MPQWHDSVKDYCSELGQKVWELNKKCRPMALIQCEISVLRYASAATIAIREIGSGSF
jgi:hypothetical protein